MKTKVFCDIAEIDLIRKFNKKKIVSGFTTNPSLMRKAGAKDYKLYSKEILKICKNKPVSLEVFADEYVEMKKQAIEINSWKKNVYVKIPVINSKGKFMGRIIKELNSENIKIPEWLSSMSSSGNKSVYVLLDGKKHYFDYKTNKYLEIPKEIGISKLRKRCPVVHW